MWEKAVKGISKITNMSKRATALLSSPWSTPMERYKQMQEKQTPPQTPDRNHIIHEENKAKTNENDTDDNSMVKQLAPESPPIIHEKKKAKINENDTGNNMLEPLLPDSPPKINRMPLEKIATKKNILCWKKWEHYLNYWLLMIEKWIT